MGIILDIILLSIIVIFAIIGAKRGFAKTAIETVGFFFAVYLSFSLCTPISTAIADKTIKPVIVSKISKALPETTQTITSEAAEIVWQSMPEYVQNLANKANITPENIATKINAMSVKTDGEVIADVITQDIVMPFVYNLVKIICAIILFVVLLVAAKLLAKLINSIFKLPLLKGFNKTIGGVFGTAQGVLFAVVLCVAMSAIISINPKGFWLFTTENIEASAIFKWLSNLSPFN